MRSSAALLPLPIVALLAVVGCNDPSSPDPGDATAGGDAGGNSIPATPPDLSGQWLSPCTANQQADGSTQYIRLDFDLEASAWALDYVVFAGEACEQALVTVSIAGPYELERPSDLVSGAWEGRFAFSSKTIRPEVDALRDALNSMDGCGTQPFETGVAQDVYASGCPGFGQYPQSQCEADYDLVRVEGNALFFGQRPADNNMCTVDRRPEALSELGSLRQ